LPHFVYEDRTAIDARDRFAEQASVLSLENPQRSGFAEYASMRQEEVRSMELQVLSLHHQTMEVGEELIDRLGIELGPSLSCPLCCALRGFKRKHG
jgi:hypothetical protein